MKEAYHDLIRDYTTAPISLQVLTYLYFFVILCNKCQTYILERFNKLGLSLAKLMLSLA